MKAIEPGCMVMIVGHPESSNNGKSATALRFVGNAADSQGRPGMLSDYWELDREIMTEMLHPKTHLPVGIFQKINFCSEKFLMRIDGHDVTPEVRCTEDAR